MFACKFVYMFAYDMYRYIPIHVFVQVCIYICMYMHIDLCKLHKSSMLSFSTFDNKYSVNDISLF